MEQLHGSPLKICIIAVVYITHEANANSAIQQIILQPRGGSTSYMTKSWRIMTFQTATRRSLTFYEPISQSEMTCWKFDMTLETLKTVEIAINQCAVRAYTHNWYNADTPSKLNSESLWFFNVSNFHWCRHPRNGVYQGDKERPRIIHSTGSATASFRNFVLSFFHILFIHRRSVLYGSLTHQKKVIGFTSNFYVTWPKTKR